MFLAQYFKREQLAFMQFQKESQGRIAAELAKKKPQQQKAKQTTKKKSSKTNTPKNTPITKTCYFYSFENYCKEIWLLPVQVPCPELFKFGSF